MRVAIVGLGRMGSAFAQRLVEKGFDVVLYSTRSGAAEEKAKELGCTAASSPDDVMKADVVLIAGWDDDYVVRVWDTLRLDDYKGVVMLISTISPLTSARLSERHTGYVEAPVVGGPGAVINGRVVTLLASKSREAKSRARSVAEAFSAKIVDAGEPPQAMVVKLAFNMILFTTIAGFAEALGYLEAHGINVELLRDVLSETWLSELAERYWRRAFEDTPASFRLDGVVKDLTLYINEAVRANFTPFASLGALDAYVSAKRVCGGDVDYPRVAKCLMDLVRGTSRRA